MPDQWADVPGRRLACRSIGSGQPVMLCTRFRGTADVWAPAFVDALDLHGVVIGGWSLGVMASSGTAAEALHVVALRTGSQ